MLKILLYPELPLLEFSCIQDCIEIFLAVASLFFWQWQLSSLAVGSYSASGNSITGSGKLFCQWELYNWQWECLVHFIPNKS
uniref:Uncharacterized protein n=1 Tax=Tanacetum cinerariifolium TaxID=118510 RepID=A0A699JZ18_TANCI|nr:hypothetical protein [Tanacetum cinerariifolium]